MGENGGGGGGGGSDLQSISREGKVRICAVVLFYYKVRRKGNSMGAGNSS